MTAKLIIDGRLPGLNEYIAAERSSRYQAAKLKRDAQALVLWSIRAQLRGVRFITPVTMHYLWVERDRRRDKDNVSSFGRKVIQDALKVAGVLQDDNWACVDGFTDAFAVDKKAPRIIVTIEEGEQA